MRMYFKIIVTIILSCCAYSLMCMDEEREVPEEKKIVVKNKSSTSYNDSEEQTSTASGGSSMHVDDFGLEVFKLDLHPLVKYYANKQRCVFVNKKELHEIVLAINETINNSNKLNINILLERVKIKKSPRTKRMLEIQKLFKSGEETIALSPFEIGNYLMPFLYHYPKKIGNTKFAHVLLSMVRNPVFDTSDSIALVMRGEQKIIQGSFAQCINGLRGLDTLKQMGIDVQEINTKEGEKSRRKLLMLVNSNPTMTDIIGTLLTMCHDVSLGTSQGLGDKDFILTDKD